MQTKALLRLALESTPRCFFGWRSPSGLTPLLVAASQVHMGVLRMLLPYLTEAQINQAELYDNCRSALDFVILGRNAGAVELLLRFNATSEYGLDPYSVLPTGKGKGGKGKGW